MLDFKIFVTGKYGKKNRTNDISDISYDKEKNIYNITYKGGDTSYTYRSKDVQIVKNCLNDKQSATVFDYLLQMAQFTDIKNDKGQNTLVNNLLKTRFINEDSVLTHYLNPQKNSIKKNIVQSLIFPFGCNKSQYEAVKTAIENQISIIQGPPGTGKTQTILNIIANLLMSDKTVLIVSNNNDATANVFEKLSAEKYCLDFICAKHGKSDNIREFLEQQKQFYPEYLIEWKNKSNLNSNQINNETTKLLEYFEEIEQIAIIKTELDKLKLELKYYNLNKPEIYNNKILKNKTSSFLMNFLQKIQFNYSERDKLGFFYKLKLKIFYGLGSYKFWQTDEEIVLDTIKSYYYPIKIKELELELKDKESYTKSLNPTSVYKKCLTELQIHIANYYSKNKERRQFKDNKDIYYNPEDLAKEYPIVLSTTFSSRATIGSDSNFLFDYVIMDEASQVDVVTGALALSCAKNAVIVGDKKQLPNVIEEYKKNVINELFEKLKLPFGYNFTNSFLSSVEQILPNTPQTLLREHYRCHPKIINFCNQQFYGGQLIIMTEDKGEKDVLCAIKTKSGKFCKERYNQRQIDVIKEDILSKYSDEEKLNLGIIAPYNNQTYAIKEQLPEIDASTVHKYQGREKDNIIISTVDDEISKFADDSNMLNVAISRAKKKLAIIISGNTQPQNSNLMSLIKYIEYNNFSVTESKVNSIFDFFFTKQNDEKFKFLRESNRISEFDSENAMNALLLKIFAEPKYSKFNFVFEMPLKQVVNKTYMQELPKPLAEYANRSWSHVDFVVYNRVTKEILFGIEVDGYNYHKKGSVQAERDAKKDKIFELIELPLLRFNTRNSNEERDIKEKLNLYCQ